LTGNGEAMPTQQEQVKLDRQGILLGSMMGCLNSLLAHRPLNEKAVKQLRKIYDQLLVVSDKAAGIENR